MRFISIAGMALALMLVPVAEATDGRTITMRADLGTDGVTEVRALTYHPMETGRRIDLTTGELIPAHYITNISATSNGVSVFRGVIGTMVSKNPYFSFKFRGGAVGDVVELSWEDNLGDSHSATVSIQ